MSQPVKTSHKMLISNLRMGYDGRACILHTLCEAPRRLISKENTLSEDILRLLFK